MIKSQLVSVIKFFPFPGQTFILFLLLIIFALSALKCDNLEHMKDETLLVKKKAELKLKLLKLLQTKHEVSDKALMRRYIQF